MASNHREVELKYELPADESVPDLSTLPGITVAAGREQDLQATYFDTKDLRLATHRILLRRRTGGSDDGWHVKLPEVKGAREEMRFPLGRNTRTVPKQVAQLVWARSRDSALRPVATIRTHRTAYDLVGDNGVVLAEVAHDRVTASAISRDAADSTWQELEVELVDGKPALLADLASHLASSGLKPSALPSKLARALGDRLPQDNGSGSPTPKSPASDVVLTYIRAQVDAMLDNDPRVRRDLPDSIHQMRVATRRLRSALRTFRRLFDRERTDPLRAELRWLATELGEARDREVMLNRLQKRIQAEPPELVLGRVGERVQIRLSQEYREAHDRVLGELDETRYRTLLDNLDALLIDPPLRDDASSPARDMLPALVHKSWKQVRRDVKLANAADTPQERDHLLHEARKKAKQARYAGEAMTAAFGNDAHQFAKAMENVQELLGDHQDSVVTRALLRELGVQSFLDGENGFTYGRLHALEQARAEAIVDSFGEVWQASSDKKLRRWLS